MSASYVIEELSLIYYIDIQQLKLNKGLALQDILTEIHSYIVKSMYFLFLKCILRLILIIIFYKYYFFPVDFPNSILIDLLCKMAEIEKRLAAGCRDAIQLNALISAFYKVRDIET